MRRTPGQDAVEVVVASDVATLQAHRDAWHELAADALESNVYYEPDPLLLALATLPPGECWQVVLLYRARRLVGLVPLRLRRLAGLGLPLSAELLRHRQSFLHVPLIRRDCAAVALRAWLAWCAGQRIPLVVCPRVTCEGPVLGLLRDELCRLGGRCLEHDRYMRPVMMPGADATSYLQEALGGDRRRELRRQRRLLDAHGELVFSWPSQGDDPDAWTEAFVALEGRGWKGRQGGALICDPAQAQHFRDLVRRMHRRGQALLFGLRLDERWIAMSCILRAAPPGTGAFAFKTAYDETLRRFAPAIVLESEFVHQLHGPYRELGWIDSCTSPGKNAAIGRLWAGRRAIGHLALAMPGLRGNVALGAYRVMLARMARHDASAAAK